MQFRNILFTSLLVSGLSFSAQAQFVGDALLFSKENNGGTARFRGLGNANTALGGDLSSITGNPAGLGFYGQSDISITANYNYANNKGDYFGTGTKKGIGQFDIDHAGFVFHYPRNEGYQGWQNFNIGLSYEKSNNFKNNIRYEGINPNNTIVSAYTDDIAFYDDQNFARDLSNMKLIEGFQDAQSGYFPITNEMNDKTQVSDVLTHGYNSRTALAFGANYNNKLYIGANIGFTAFRYESSSQFSEYGWTKDRAAIVADNPKSTFADPTHENYDFLEANYELLDDYYQISEGTGIDFKIGAIYKPAVDWNIGATIASPTWLTIDDYTESYLGVDYFDSEDATSAFSSKELISTPTEDSYKLNTPWKFSVGVTKFFNGGLLTADVEYIDYASMKLKSYDRNSAIEDAWNSDVKATYQGVVNARVGGEILLTSILSGRAGFNYYGNPYKDADNKEYSGSLGVGAKLSNTMYLDLAVVHQVNEFSVSPYIVDEFWGTPSPVADIKKQRTNVVLTLGAKF
ncbi:MAG: OmpP1/FadL family transporter [Sphingobacterium sp.]|uniref:OmpP1/FadL family transporter n=1 Tax=Sphingobacterium sp. JB170 TaxID=1434842 RepID=UPI00097EA8A8|nr:hypothetical protein [Sphingobacterium sp. JB170]SJN38915.1 putative hemin receptor [Sphingobacterium sp. JB170]